MSSSYVKVGALACQMNSFQKDLVSKVVSCTPFSQKKVKGFHVMCEDSILFPEGGGQNWDLGWLFTSEDAFKRNAVSEALEVSKVVRDGDRCLMVTSKPLEVGTTVWQKVDWERRIDQMHHHTGQHLLTAVTIELLGLDTISFSILPPSSFIQVDVGLILKDPESPLRKWVDEKEKRLTPEGIKLLQDRCVELIQSENSQVRCISYESREAFTEAMKDSYRSRVLPADVTGPIRMIQIKDFDQCLCCGTHISHLKQLGAFYIMPHQEVKGTLVKLFFVAGDRAEAQFKEMYLREREITGVLCGTRPEAFPKTIQDRIKAATALEKRTKQLYLELAALQAKEICGKNPDARVIVHRRDDVTIEFFEAFRSAMDSNGYSHMLLVAGWSPETGDSKADRPGQVWITADTATPVDAAKPRLEALAAVVKGVLEGLSGGFSRSGFRGKGSFKDWDKVEEAVRAATDI